MKYLLGFQESTFCLSSRSKSITCTTKIIFVCTEFLFKRVLMRFFCRGHRFTFIYKHPRNLTFELPSDPTLSPQKWGLLIYCSGLFPTNIKKFGATRFILGEVFLGFVDWTIMHYSY